MCLSSFTPLTFHFTPTISYFTPSLLSLHQITLVMSSSGSDIEMIKDGVLDMLCQTVMEAMVNLAFESSTTGR